MIAEILLTVALCGVAFGLCGLILSIGEEESCRPESEPFLAKDEATGFWFAEQAGYRSMILGRTRKAAQRRLRKPESFITWYALPKKTRDDPQSAASNP